MEGRKEGRKERQLPVNGAFTERPSEERKYLTKNLSAVSESVATVTIHRDEEDFSVSLLPSSSISKEKLLLSLSLSLFTFTSVATLSPASCLPFDLCSQYFLTASRTICMPRCFSIYI